MNEHDDNLPGEGAVRGASRLVGGLFVDELANGAVFFSLVLIVGAISTMDPPRIALGVAVGLIGMALPWCGMRKSWSDSTMLLVALVVLVLDAGTAWLLWQHL